MLIQPWGLETGLAVRARVVYSSLVEFLWFHGCQLDHRLTDDQLQGWLRSAPLARLMGAPCPGCAAPADPELDGAPEAPPATRRAPLPRRRGASLWTKGMAFRE